MGIDFHKCNRTMEASFGASSCGGHDLQWDRPGDLTDALTAAEAAITAALAGVPNADALQASLQSVQRAKIGEAIRSYLAKLERENVERRELERERERSAIAGLLKVRAERESRRNTLLLWRSVVTTGRNQALLDCMEQENVKLKLKVKKFVNFLARESQM